MIRHFKKPLSLVLCLLMVISALLPVSGDVMPFKKDYESHWAAAAIQSAIDTGISKGYPDGSFRPDNLITRAEFFALVNNAFNFTSSPEATFTDVPADAWYAPVIAKAKYAMYVSGYPDGSIHPDSNITRQETAMIFFKLIKLEPDESSAEAFVDSTDIAPWAKGPVGGVIKASVMRGYPENTFLPDRFLSRAEAIIVIRGSLILYMAEEESPLGVPAVSEVLEVLVPSEKLTPVVIPSSGSSGGGGGGGGGGTGTRVPTPVSAISVSAEGDVSSMDIGGTLQMTAIVIPADAENKEVIWSVTNGTGTAAIGENGLLTAAAAGTVTATAANPASGITGSKTVTINPEPNLEQQAPDGLVGEAPTSEANNDGRIIGTTTAMEYKVSTEPTVWTQAPDAEIIGLSADTYQVRYAAKAGYDASAAVNVTVPQFIPADQPPPTGLVGVAPTSVANNDGRITGTTSAMEYKLSTEPLVWTPATGSAITGLVPGAYNVRYAAKPGYGAGTAANVTVPVFVPANQPAPTGLVGVAPTTDANLDGKITGTTTAMEYKMSTEPLIWTPAPGSAITGLVPGAYNVRYAAKPGFNAGTAANVTVPVFIPANQPAPTGLAGVAPTTDANTDGRITGTTTAMEYKTSTEPLIWIPAPGSAITGLVPGAYNVRYAAKPGFNAGAVANVTVPVFVPANQPAPTGLAGVAPTTDANIDGRITGTTTAMEYKPSTQTNWTQAPGTAITGLVPGAYNVRYAAKPGFNAGTAANINVPAYALGNQPAPTGLAGVAPTSSANNDGRITGSTTAMEYKRSTETNWTPAPSPAITGLSSGTYNVRFAAKPGFNPGTPANVVVPVYANQLAEAKLIFTFDDGWQDNLINAWPIMDAAGFKGTMYINRDIINGVGPNIMTYDNLDTLYSYGWDLGNHTTNHYDNGDRTDATTLALLRSIYLDNQNWLLANNWVRGAYHACYPSGKYSDQLIEILKEIGVLTGRATDESSAGNTQTIPVSNFYKLPVQYVETEQSNLNDVKAAIKYAVDHGTTAILMIHKVQPTDGTLVVTTSDFQQIVTYAKGFSDQGSLSVMTMSDWYNEVAPQ